jgi:hypothetical protein
MSPLFWVPDDASPLFWMLVVWVVGAMAAITSAPVVSSLCGWSTPLFVVWQGIAWSLDLKRKRRAVAWCLTWLGDGCTPPAVRFVYLISCATNTAIDELAMDTQLAVLWRLDWDEETELTLHRDEAEVLDEWLSSFSRAAGVKRMNWHGFAGQTLGDALAWLTHRP